MRASHWSGSWDGNTVLDEGQVEERKSCLATLWKRWSSINYRAEDTAEDREVKAILLPAVAVLGIACTITSITRRDPLENTFGLARIAVAAMVPVVAVFAVTVNRSRLTERAVALYMPMIYAVDLSTAAELQTRGWSLVVVAVDALLVASARQQYVTAVIVCTLVYLYAVLADQVAGFGLLRAGRLGNSDVPQACDCSSPPCALPTSDGISAGIMMTAVFLLDFHMTRGFAMSMRQQMEVVSSAISTCDQLTERLARYEIELAREVLSGKSGTKLPEQLRKSYWRLLDNLDSYRPYLPDSLLLAEDVAQSTLSTAPPPGEGLDEADVCVVFTDVQSSTALWEEYHQGMYEALQQHNAVLRSTAAAHDGYEVKTIGDAFMVAFSDVQLAVQFAVEAQRQLLATEWPLDLLQAPLCRGIDGGGDLLWKGLRVRIGMHCGPVRVERNPVTHRCDYFGPPVNVAARIESEIRCGGLIGVSEEVVRRLGRGLEELGLQRHPLGARQLKGVGAPVGIDILLPRELWERRRVLDSAPDEFATKRRMSGVSSSVESTMSAHVPRDAVNARLRLQLKSTVGSSAHVKFTLTPATLLKVPQLVSAVELAADVSQGLLQSVLSSSCLVTWNGPRPCAAHAMQCAHFLSVVEQQCDAVSLRSFAGAASGKLLSGNLASRRRRFATVTGSCVEMAGHVAAVAEMQGLRALVTDHVAAHNVARRVGSLQMDDCDAMPLYALEDDGDATSQAWEQPEFCVQLPFRAPLNEMDGDAVDSSADLAHRSATDGT
eukprot:TRINITY_DN2321_c0_g1_i9.p1 TRINITY_DN2321_c0_g1~~TRINITY_DN2321_c0_g1_i9.p1  ORF type:complete len:795 (+),score=184.97 TRINITY_DN2321_c0_g1_i9:60-2387(+)